jgi:hypothetical protein
MSQQIDQRAGYADTQEEILVRRWRRAQFMRMGFTLRDAQRLTAAPVDLAEMRRLVAAGCPLSTAQRILL